MSEHLRLPDPSGGVFAFQAGSGSKHGPALGIEVAGEGRTVPEPRTTKGTEVTWLDNDNMDMPVYVGLGRVTPNGSHRSLASFRRPQCFSFRSGLNFRST
jgi:hypothetical protein